MLVILIIGILAAVALPQYQKAVKKGRITEIYSVIKTLQQALEAQVLANGFPTERIHPILDVEIPCSTTPTLFPTEGYI